MTREEALAVLKTNYRCMTEEKNCPRTCEGCGLAMQPGELEEAIRVAIKTLEPKTGHWEWVPYDYNPKLGNWHCSECRCVVVECVDKNEKGGIPLYKYCPQCGTKMVEPRESEG